MLCSVEHDFYNLMALFPARAKSIVGFASRKLDNSIYCYNCKNRDGSLAILRLFQR